MKRTLFPLAALLVCAALLWLPPNASAQIGGQIITQPQVSPAPNVGAMPGTFLPGLNFGHLYPFNPFPYRPHYSPYNMPYPISPYGPFNYYGYGGGSYGGMNGTMGPINFPEMVPHPTASTRVAPPDAAVIHVRTPDKFANVFFNGAPTSSTGKDRYYVTPTMARGKDCYYVVTAEWKANGKTQRDERTVSVLPGQVKEVDFSKPATAEEERKLYSSPPKE